MIDKTAILIILDKSSSMSTARKPTIDGFNEFLDEQLKNPKPASVSLVQFDTTYHVVYVDKPLTEVPRLDENTYVPGGMTALLDAVGRGVFELGERLRVQPEDQRPDKVMVLIITDGEENASKEFTRDQIRQMIETQEKTYSWNFVFIGANINAYKAGGQLGIRDANIAQYSTQTADDVKSAYKGVSQAVSRSRDASSSVLRSQGVLSTSDKKLIERHSSKPKT